MKKQSLIRRRLAPAQPGKFILPVSTLQPGDQVILCCRVSGRAQARKSNLDNQAIKLQDEMNRLGVRVVDVCRFVGSGWDPWWLEPLAVHAGQVGAKLVATDVTRFLRSRLYGKTSQHSSPTLSEFNELMLYTLGVPLITLLDPDASPGQCRWFESELGTRTKAQSQAQQIADRKAVWELIKRLPGS